MAKKKRIDRKRDNTSLQRVAKTATAALAIGAGVAVFRNTKFARGDFQNLLSATKRKRTF